ncbi:ribonuclease E/G, partial [bacterium]|nr:ribonuclease E/G [bacterium]
LSGIEGEEHAVIIRTAGIGRSLAELKKDYTALKKNWEEIQKAFLNKKKPGLILEEADAITRTLRDYYTEDIKEIWIDSPDSFQKALDFIKQVSPRNQKTLKLFVGDRSLFATYNIEGQVEQLTSNSIRLKSGGSIVIEQTEALVAIDVNSGKSNQEGNIDSTAVRTNLEAAEEIARQLKLRNLGGLIVIDFIDMEDDKNRKRVEETLKSAMETDKAQLKFNPISIFGLLEMSRQRLSVAISNTVESVCPVCKGKGKIPSLLTYTNLIIRSIRELAAKGNLLRIDGVLPLEVVNHLLNERRQSITDLELEFGISIILHADPNILALGEHSLKPVYEGKKPAKPFDKKDESKGDLSTKRNERSDKEHDEKQEKTPDIIIEPVNDHVEKKSTHNKAEIEEKVKNKKVDPEEKTDVNKGKPEEKVDNKNVNSEEKTDNNKIHSKERVDFKTSQRSKKKPAKKDKSRDNSVENSEIHPSCLFSDVRELDEAELEEVTTSFENRLKGKIDNQPPRKIDNKYLWKINKETGTKSQETQSKNSIESEKKESPLEKTDSKVNQKTKPTKMKPMAKKATKDNRNPANTSTKSEVSKNVVKSTTTTASKKPANTSTKNEVSEAKKKPKKKTKTTSDNKSVKKATFNDRTTPKPNTRKKGQS